MRTETSLLAQNPHLPPSLVNICGFFVFVFVLKKRVGVKMAIIVFQLSKSYGMEGCTNLSLFSQPATCTVCMSWLAVSQPIVLWYPRDSLAFFFIMTCTFIGNSLFLSHV